MKKLIALPFLLLFTLACTITWPVQPPPPAATATATVVPSSPTVAPSPTIIATISPTVDQVLVAYDNQRYGYGISFPQTLTVNVISDEYVEIGDKIVIAVWTTNPTELRGDGPVFESSADVQTGLYPARLLTGYIGAIGGYIPQQIRMYVFQRPDHYVTITLYALGLHVTEGDVTQIAPMNPDDVTRFDLMVTNVRFK